MTEKKNPEVQKADGEPEPRTSRRGLFASLGAGAAAAALVNPGKIFAATPPPIPSIRIPKEVTDTLAEATHIGDFGEKTRIGVEAYFFDLHRDVAFVDEEQRRFPRDVEG